MDLTTDATIQEDDPRWDCHTMGNRECGPNQTTSDDGTAWTCWVERNPDFPTEGERICGTPAQFATVQAAGNVVHLGDLPTTGAGLDALAAAGLLLAVAGAALVRWAKVGRSLG